MNDHMVTNRRCRQHSEPAVDAAPALHGHRGVYYAALSAPSFANESAITCSPAIGDTSSLCPPAFAHDRIGHLLSPSTRGSVKGGPRTGRAFNRDYEPADRTWEGSMDALPAPGDGSHQALNVGHLVNTGTYSAQGPT